MNTPPKRSLKIKSKNQNFAADSSHEEGQAPIPGNVRHSSLKIKRPGKVTPPKARQGLKIKSPGASVEKIQNAPNIIQQAQSQTESAPRPAAPQGGPRIIKPGAVSQGPKIIKPGEVSQGPRIIKPGNASQGPKIIKPGSTSQAPRGLKIRSAPAKVNQTNSPANGGRGLTIKSTGHEDRQAQAPRIQEGSSKEFHQKTVNGHRDSLTKSDSSEKAQAGQQSLNGFANEHKEFVAKIPVNIFGEVKTARRTIAPGMDSTPTVPLTPTPKPASQREQINEYQDAIGNTFCIIPKGKYLTGPEKDEVELEANFGISKYPVTKAQFFLFLTETENNYTPDDINIINQLAPYPTCPALNVSWEDAKNYCRWLRKKTNEFYNLPSSDEWEAAARGFNGRSFPWGESEPEHSNALYFDGVNEPLTCATVDYYQSNSSPFGPMGMVGNVMEWVNDSFDDERDPHILKGGSWRSPIDFLNCGMSVLSYPATRREDYFGFRLLHVPKEHFPEYYRKNMS